MDYKKEKSIIDIDNYELKSIEEELYINHILTFNNKYYISNSDVDILEEDYYRLKQQLPENCSRIGRNFFPTQAFELLKIIFYSYQLKKSEYDLYILKDPAGIDNSNLLDSSLVSDSILHSMVKKLGLGISEGEIYVYLLSKREEINKNIENGRMRQENIDVLDVLSGIQKRLERLIDTFIMPNINMQKLEKGFIYALYFNKGLITLECLGNVIEIRYKNIIKINREKLKEEHGEDNDYWW